MPRRLRSGNPEVDPIQSTLTSPAIRLPGTTVPAGRRTRAEDDAGTQADLMAAQSCVADAMGLAGPWITVEHEYILERKGALRRPEPCGKGLDGLGQVSDPVQMGRGKGDHVFGHELPPPRRVCQAGAVSVLYVTNERVLDGSQLVGQIGEFSNYAVVFHGSHGRRPAE